MLSVLTVSATALADGILIASDSGGDILAVDTADGTNTLIGPSSGGLGVASSPVNGFWYTRNFTTLYTFDVSTGVSSPVGPSGTFITGLAFDVAFTTLYSVNQNTGEFYTVDPANGTATLVGNTGILTPLDLSTDSTGVLWAADAGGSIHTIDPVTGTATLVAADADPRGFTAISFDANDNLYGITLTGDMLVLIDTTNGTTSDVGGPMIRGDVRGMDFDRTNSIVIPTEPATSIPANSFWALMLLILAITLTVVARHNRRV